MKIETFLLALGLDVVTVAGPVVLPIGSWTMTSKTTKPLSDACDGLVAKYNWLITYEEAPVLSSSELCMRPRPRPGLLCRN